MLPLQPPDRSPTPGYPARSQALADEALRRRLHGILAASVLGLALGGCGSAGSTPQPQPPMGGAVPAPGPAQPQALPGEAPAPQPAPQAEPQPLGGKPSAPRPAPAEPAQLRGDVAVPQPPPAIPAGTPAGPKAEAPAQPKADAPREIALPHPMVGLMAIPPPPQRDPA